MTIVLDSCAAIEIVLNRENAIKLREILNSADEVVTSSLYKVEVANVLLKYSKGGFIEKNICDKLLTLAESLIDDFIDISENNHEALREAIRLNHSVYDMLFITIARSRNAELLTLDKRLKDLAERENISHRQS
jgi:predicted nucleic acid-binding protein